MKFIELAEKRCSIRSYKSEPVPDEILNEVLRAGQLAPTAKNLQPFQFIVVTAESGRDALAAAYPAPFFREAPVAVVICSEADKGWIRNRHDDKNYTDIDCAIAIDHMSLAATDLGLGSCWIAAFNPVMVSDTMGLPGLLRRRSSPIYATPESGQNLAVVCVQKMTALCHEETFATSNLSQQKPAVAG